MKDKDAREQISKLHLSDVLQLQLMDAMDRRVNIQDERIRYLEKIVGKLLLLLPNAVSRRLKKETL